MADLPTSASSSKGHWAPGFADFPDLPEIATTESPSSSPYWSESSEFDFADDFDRQPDQEPSFDGAEDWWLLHVMKLAAPRIVAKGFERAEGGLETDGRTFAEVNVRRRREPVSGYIFLREISEDEEWEYARLRIESGGDIDSVVISRVTTPVMPSGGEKRKRDAGDSEEDGAPAPAVDEEEEESRPAPSSGRKTGTEAYRASQQYVILPPAPAPPPEVQCGWNGCTHVVSHSDVAAGVEHWRGHFARGSATNTDRRYRCGNPDCDETGTYSHLERHWVHHHFGITWRCPVAGCDLHKPLTRRDEIANRLKSHQKREAAKEKENQQAQARGKARRRTASPPPTKRRKT
ncbi:hypothetical protein C8Q76DRAFT_737097 [Earliella scabrosa]|nr:hypothetical protein C8Q76DRAFT_737097 [Earliella scabrosa]